VTASVGVPPALPSRRHQALAGAGKNSASASHPTATSAGINIMLRQRLRESIIIIAARALPAQDQKQWRA